MLFRLTELITNFLFAQQIVRPEGSCKSDRCKYTAEVYDKRARLKVEPCDNFFKYVCGNYYPERNIHRSYINPSSEREQEIDKKISTFLYNGPGQTDPAFTHIRSFYTACKDKKSLNFGHIESELNFLGFSLKCPLLDEKSTDEMFATKILAKLHATSVGASGFLFKMSVEVQESEFNHQRVIKIAEASDIIYKNFNHLDFSRVSVYYYSKKVIREFHEHLKIDLTTEENETFESQVGEVLEFLLQLKEINETPREMIMQVDEMNVKSFQDLIDNELAGGVIQLNWKVFLEILFGLYNQSVESIVESTENIIFLYDVGKFKKILQLLRGTRFEVFISAMWWTAVDMLLYQSPHPFHQYHEIYGIRHPIFIQIGRKPKCLMWLRRHFPLFVAHVLATEDDSSRIKNEVEEMVTNIKESFSKNLRLNKWITCKTKHFALKKLEEMKFIVGYTDLILKSSSVEKAYENTHVAHTNFLFVLCELFRKERKRNLLLLLSLDSPINELELNTPEVEVKYNPLAQSVVIPMSMLRFPFYQLGLDVLNYGAIGVHIAYGIARAFDYIWTKPRAKSIVKCFRMFYDTLSLGRIKRCVDGDVTLFSNLADAVGFKVSMDAYKIRAKAKGYEQTLPVRKYKEVDKKSATKKADDESSDDESSDDETLNDESPDDKSSDGESSDGESSDDEWTDDEWSDDEWSDDVWSTAKKNKKKLIVEEEKDEQLFIRAFANSLCEKGKTEYYLQKTESDVVPLNMARVNGVLMNKNIFARKWNCSHQKWMNPQQKCKIWN